MQSRDELLQAIRFLPDETKLLPEPLKETWIEWLSPYADRSDRRKNTDRDAQFVFNKLNSPSMIIWLAEASGIDDRLLQRAMQIAGRAGPKETLAATIRNILPWKLVSDNLALTVAALTATGKPLAKKTIEVAVVQPTTIQSLVDMRVGQDKFRASLEREWNGTCAVTGCGILQMLRASHIKPWETSTDLERLDSENGLLLTAHIDALFDEGLISFEDDGTMLLSRQIGIKDRMYFRLPGKLRVKPSKRRQKFLNYHRDHIFNL
jgi:predicted restriction endonuclease